MPKVPKESEALSGYSIDSMDSHAEALGFWESSSQAWIRLMEEGDQNRESLLDPVMMHMAEPMPGQRALDVGCGEGRFCRLLAQEGMVVTGIDPVLDFVAKARREHPEGTYDVGIAEALPYADASFDLVVCYVALVDIGGFRTAIVEMARVLKPGGRLLIANLNPFVTAGKAWYRDDEGKKLHFPVDEYFVERPNRVTWAEIDILNWHRPMEAYMSALLGAGLILREFREPRPTAKAIAEHPKLAEGLRVPYFHVMLWQRPELHRGR